MLRGSITGGVVTHGFGMEFESGADRDGYVGEEDVGHLGFVRGVEVLVKEVWVVDFEDGVF